MAVLYAVAAWLIMQVAEVVIGLANLPEWIGPAILGLLAVGFPIAVVLSWFYELTPEGISLEKDIDAAESITRVTGRRLDIIVISMLCAAVILFAYDKWWIGPPPEASIAVLPFVNMSADADNEYFSDGISEELLNVLVKVSTLHVASRTSAFAYKGKDLPLSQIARELNVENILEGSVRKAGNRVRITAQLINAKSDRHIWSEIYERELVDIFDIQEEISNNIVDALKVALNVGDAAALERAQRPTENAEAYELYLQGRYAWRLRHEDNILRSIDLFEQAIALDPNFARAYEALAASWAVITAWSDVPRREALPHFRSNSEKALRLDPSLAEARSTLAEALTFAGDWAGARAQFKLAIESEPRNPIPHKMFAETLRGMGYSKSALEEILLAYGLDPASPAINRVIVQIAVGQHKDELALKHKLISDGLGSGHVTVWDLYDQYVREENWPALDAWLNWPPESWGMQCIAAERDPDLRLVLRQAFDKKLQRVDYVPPETYLFSYCLALSGYANKAAEILRNRVIENQDWFMITLSWKPNGPAHAIRQTAEFKALLSELGLVDHYRQHGWPDLCRPLGEEDFECD
jgi:serine/threonine-protein kinase